MPKRSFSDRGSESSELAMAPKKVSPKTERSHEENQERAYIAASRRADRSIEARVQSARMASDIHKKRTGKGFKISEEIVMKEEMYEEEEDETPRAYRLMGAHLETTSPEFNSRVNAYLSANVAMRSIAYQNEINRQFDECFPTLSRSRMQQQQPMYASQTPPQQQQQQQQQQQHHHHHHNHHHGSPRHAAAAFSPMDYQAASPAHLRSQSMSHAVDISPRTSVAAGQSPSFRPRHSSVDVALSPPPLSNGPDTPQTPVLHNIDAYPGASSSASMEPMVAVAPAHVPIETFTHELPNDVKQLVDLDWNDPMTSSMFGMENDAGGPDSDAFQFVDYAPSVKQPIPARPDFAPQTTRSAADYFTSLPHASSQYIDLPGQPSTIGTPGGGVGDSWESWINTNEFATDEH